MNAANNQVQAGNSAGFGVRLSAYLLDCVLLWPLCIVPIFIFMAFDDVERSELTRTSLGAALNWLEINFSYVGLIVQAIYLVGFWFYCGATPGKIWWKLRIVDARTGGKPTFLQCLVRYFGYILSSLPFYLGFFWVLFDSSKQGWHDKLARTKVVFD